jgi:hypothetical protein
VRRQVRIHRSWDQNELFVRVNVLSVLAAIFTALGQTGSCVPSHNPDSFNECVVYAAALNE